MNEKQKVVQCLRACLTSSQRDITIDELINDYRKIEGKNVKTFEYKNILEFLTSTGEFNIFTKNGKCYVRENIKYESMHVKKLVLEQKSNNNKNGKCFMTSFDQKIGKDTLIVTDCNTNRKREQHIPVAPAHIGKPTATFTFRGLMDPSCNSAAINLPHSSTTKNASLYESSSLKTLMQPKENQNSNLSKLISTKKSDNINNNKSTTVNSSSETTSSSYLKLKELYPSLLYKQISSDIKNSIFQVAVEVDNIAYYGIGSTARGANNDAAKDCLKAIENGKHELAVRYYATKELDSNDWDSYWPYDTGDNYYNWYY